MSERAGQRIAAFALAGVFLLSSVALTGFVLYQIKIENDRNNQVTPETPAVTEGPTLKGTKLADFTPLTAPAPALQIIDISEGTGDVVAAGATITAHYTGAYAVNGEIFESSKDTGKPAQFSLDGVIPGWTEGVPGMKVGGKRRLIIPGEKAYGVAPEGYTPGSTARPLGTLVFDIELVSAP